MQPDPVLALYSRLAHVSETLSDANLASAVAHLRTHPCTPGAISVLSASVAQEAQREALHHLAQAWEQRAPHLTGAELAAALLALREARHREPSAEIAWTGPAGKSSSYRTTQELIHDLIDAAEQRLLVVTYAVTEVASLKARLESALARNVRIRFVLEHFDAFQQDSRAGDFKNLGSALLEASRIYIWPESNRTQVGSQWRGSLHTKCVVQDTRAVFLTSANWTAAAMDQNMEMGVLLPDPTIAEKVWSHFDDLIATRTLRQWHPPHRD